MSSLLQVSKLYAFPIYQSGATATERCLMAYLGHSSPKLLFARIASPGNDPMQDSLMARYRDLVIVVGLVNRNRRHQTLPALRTEALALIHGWLRAGYGQVTGW